MLEGVGPATGPPGALRRDLIRYFGEHRKLLAADALALLLASTEPIRVSRRVLDELNGTDPFVTRAMVERVLARPVPAGPRVPPPSVPESPAAPFELIAEGFTAASPGRGPLEAYGELFTSRFRSLEHLLQGRPDLANRRPIRELGSREGSTSVIGMVRAVRQTSERKHLILEVEDESGVVEVLLPRDRPAARESYLADEVLGLNLAMPRERRRLPVVTGVHRPDVPAIRTGRRAGGHRRVLFLSDLHLGSRAFLTECWQALVAFLREQGPNPEIAREIAHVVIAGDLVDGIGIYPNQETDLAIHDIFEQYAELGRRLRELPGRLDIVVVPGNHDAVCPAEPQPALAREIRSSLPTNVHALGNPSTFALEGVLIEAYHGRSFDDLIPAIPGATYARPTEVMKRMLAMRHLAPMYGGRTPLAPLPRDGLVIDPVPDILVTGHAHTYGVDQYRGVLLLNASTWQAETAYQRMRNITPMPARAAVVDLADLTLASFDFTSARPAEAEVASA